MTFNRDPERDGAEQLRLPAGRRAAGRHAEAIIQAEIRRLAAAIRPAHVLPDRPDPEDSPALA